MSKLEFLKQLEQLLMDIPEEERTEAIRYYEDYFDDAVDKDEDQLIKEIGSPEKVARQIKIDLYNKASKDAGVYTENGYSNAYFDDKNEEISVTPEQTNYQNTYSNGYQTPPYQAQPYPQKQNNNNVVLIILLVLTAPIWGSLAIGLVSAVGAGIIGLFAGLGAAFVGLLVAGVCCFGVGITQLFVDPGVGILLIGTGFILLAISLLFLCVLVVIATKVVPAVINGIRNLWQWIFHRGERR